MKTTPLPSGRFVTTLRTSAVKVSQPFLECELALCARTVKHALSHKTPASASALRSLDGLDCGQISGIGHDEMYKPSFGNLEAWDVGGYLLVDVTEGSRYFCGWEDGERESW